MSSAFLAVPPALADDWQVRACARTRARLEGGWREGLPWRRGLWVTARTNYRARLLPRGFEIVEFDVPSGRRRMAVREGRGRPLLILPGLYAGLDEALFSEIASTAAAHTSRPVALLEDRLAASTLRISGGHWTSFAEQGHEAQLAARLLSSRPSVLALSAGAMVALNAPAGTWHQLAAWSAVVDASTVRCVRGSWIASWHYRRQHSRAFQTAGLSPPDMNEVLMTLFRCGPTPPPHCPALFVHAEDDPIAPAAAVRRRIEHPLVTRWGGHLGFGTVAGEDVYLSPFD